MFYTHDPPCVPMWSLILKGYFGVFIGIVLLSCHSTHFINSDSTANLEESFSTSDPVLDIFEDLEDSRIDPVLNIFEDLVNGSDIQNRPVQDKERAKNFSLKVLEKMFEEKILEVSRSLEVKKMIEHRAEIISTSTQRSGKHFNWRGVVVSVKNCLWKNWVKKSKKI